MDNRWTSLAAFLALLLYAGAADGLMELLGPAGFAAVGAAVMAACWRLAGRKEEAHGNDPVR